MGITPLSFWLEMWDTILSWEIILLSTRRATFLAKLAERNNALMMLLIIE